MLGQNIKRGGGLSFIITQMVNVPLSLKEIVGGECGGSTRPSSSATVL